MDGPSRKALARNGMLLVLPPLAISMGLWSRLPGAFAPQEFSRGMPEWLSFSENALRLVVFALPAGLSFGRKNSVQRAGWWVYGLGLALYVASYALLVAWPRGSWASSAFGFTAPAWTPATFLLGIAMVCHDARLVARWKWWMYLGPALAFVALHLLHAALVWERVQGS